MRGRSLIGWFVISAMKRIGLFAVILVAPSAYGQSGPPPAAKPPLTRGEISRFVPSGEKWMIGFFTSLWPDCTLRGRVVGSVTTPPQHGLLAFAPLDSFPSFPPTNAQAKCNENKIAGQGLYYTSEQGFAGEDSADIFLIYPDGSGGEIHYTIIVKPISLAPPSSVDPCALAADNWKSAESVGTIAALEDHIARFSNCAYAGLAMARLKQLKDKVANTPAAAPQPAEQPADHQKLFYGAIVRWSDQFGFNCCDASLEGAQRQALTLCKSDECKLESTMSGTQCFVLFRLKRGASGPFGWAVGENIDAASKKALTKCLTYGTSCTKTASLCADGSNYYHWRGAPLSGRRDL
jgi:Domain of unknown function (DUF4189)